VGFVATEVSQRFPAAEFLVAAGIQGATGPGGQPTDPVAVKNAAPDNEYARGVKMCIQLPAPLLK
jgi:hypothetical protein